MWRIFRWLDTHEPGFYKFMLLLLGLALIVGCGWLVGQLHPAAGILFAFGSCFALMHASMTYRFRKKPRPEPESGLPISQASDREILRRVHRHAKTEYWRKRILWLAEHDRGKQGDLARSIKKGWEEAGCPDGLPPPRNGTDAQDDKPRSE